MRIRAFLGAVTVLAGVALPVPALAEGAGTVAGLRAQVTRFVNAELHHDAATVCDILGAPLNATVHSRTCTERWRSQIKSVLAQPGGRSDLRSDIAAAATAAVTSNGVHASITLPHALVDGKPRSHFFWTDNCWMLTS
jgi:hypothetical protein